ncbi:MAG: CBS domain-containing protein [Fervidicoccaceae archaeon]|jgi:CBS domain-containing protein
MSKTSKGTVEAIMSKPPITMHKNDSVLDAAKLMFNNRIGSVLVVDDSGKLIGIVTERDLVYLVSLGKSHLASEYPVWQLMTENPVTAKPTDSIEEALARMKEINVRHLPVVDEDGRPVGVISVRDIIDFMLRMIRIIHG